MGFVADAVGSVVEFVGDAISDVVEFAVDEIIEPVVEFVGDTISNLAENPISTIATIASFATGIPLIAVVGNAAQTAVNGGSLGDVLKSAALTFAGQQIGAAFEAGSAGEFAAFDSVPFDQITAEGINQSSGFFNSALNSVSEAVQGTIGSVVSDPTAANLLTQATIGGGRGAVTALITGEDPVDAFVRGGLTAGVRAGVGLISEELTASGTFDNIPENLRDPLLAGASASIASIASTGELNEAAVANAVLSASITTQVVSDFVAENTDLDLSPDHIQLATRTLNTSVKNLVTGAGGAQNGSEIAAIFADFSLRQAADSPLVRNLVNSVKGIFEDITGGVSDAFNSVRDLVTEAEELGTEIGELDSGAEADRVAFNRIRDSLVAQQEALQAEHADLLEQSRLFDNPSAAVQEAQQLEADRADFGSLGPVARRRLEELRPVLDAFNAQREAFNDRVEAFNVRNEAFTQAVERDTPRLNALSERVESQTASVEALIEQFNEVQTSLEGATAEFNTALQPIQQLADTTAIQTVAPDFEIEEFARANNVDPADATNFFFENTLTEGGFLTLQDKENALGPLASLAINKATSELGVDITRIDADALSQLRSGLVDSFNSVEAFTDSIKDGTIIDVVNQNAANVIDVEVSNDSLSQFASANESDVDPVEELVGVDPALFATSGLSFNVNRDGGLELDVNGDIVFDDFFEFTVQGGVNQTGLTFQGLDVADQNPQIPAGVAARLYGDIISANELDEADKEFLKQGLKDNYGVTDLSFHIAEKFTDLARETGNDALLDTISVVQRGSAQFLKSVSKAADLIGLDPNNNALLTYAERLAEMGNAATTEESRAANQAMQEFLASRKALVDPNAGFVTQSFQQLFALGETLAVHPAATLREIIGLEAASEVPSLLLGGIAFKTVEAGALLTQTAGVLATKLAGKAGIAATTVADTVEAYGSGYDQGYESIRQTYEERVRNGEIQLTPEQIDVLAKQAAVQQGSFQALASLVTDRVGGLNLERALFGDKRGGDTALAQAVDAVNARGEIVGGEVIAESLDETSTALFNQLLVSNAGGEADFSGAAAESFATAAFVTTGVTSSLIAGNDFANVANTVATTPGAAFDFAQGTGDILADTLLASPFVNDVLTKFNNGDFSFTESARALEDLGITDQATTNNLFSTVRPTDFVNTAQVVDAFQTGSFELGDAAFDVSFDDINSFVEQGAFTDLQGAVDTFINANFVEDTELNPIALEEGLTLADFEDLQPFLGQRPEEQTLEEFRIAADAAATNPEEARAIFEGFGFEPTEEQVEQFVGATTEDEQRAAIEEFVDPRFVDEQEVRDFFEAVGVTATEEDITQFAGQFDEEEQRTLIEEAADPRAVDVDEARTALEEQLGGFLTPTDEQIQQFVGENPESELDAVVSGSID